MSDLIAILLVLWGIAGLFAIVALTILPPIVWVCEYLKRR